MVRRITVELDPGEVTSLSLTEIKTILRGADELIMNGGRNMLAKILTGSRDKKLLAHHFDASPVYGAYKGTSQKEMLHKIDWLLLNDYLKIEYNNRTPVLTYTQKGWEIEKETYADELLDKLLDAANLQNYEFVETLKDRDRGMIILLLEKIANTKKAQLIPILDAWHEIESKKVKKAIEEVIDELEHNGTDTVQEKDEKVVSLVAKKKWLAIPEVFRKRIENNVWCSTCITSVKIKDYTVKEYQGLLELDGKCAKCGNEVSRVID